MKANAVAARGVWGVGGQAANTFGNLVVTLVIAANFPAEDFGAWSIGYAATLIVLTVSRTLFSTPLLLLGDTQRVAKESKGALAASACFGVSVGAVGAVAILLVNSPLAAIWITFAAVLPIILVQDCFRHVYIAAQRPHVTALMDTAWLLGQCALLFLLSEAAYLSPVSVTLVWALSALLSFTGVARAKYSIRDAVTFCRTWAWAQRRLLIDSVLNGLSTYALPVVVAITGGLAATASLRGAQTLFGPVGIIVSGLAPIVTVEATRNLRGPMPKVWAIFYGWSALVGVVAALFAVVLTLMPASMGPWLLGDSWAGVLGLLLPLSLHALLRGPVTGGPIVLRSLNRLNEAVRLRFATSAISLVIPALIALKYGAVGAAWGIALSALVAGAVSAVYLWSLKRSRRLTPVPQ